MVGTLNRGLTQKPTVLLSGFVHGSTSMFYTSEFDIPWTRSTVRPRPWRATPRRPDNDPLFEEGNRPVYPVRGLPIEIHTPFCSWAGPWGAGIPSAPFTVVSEGFRVALIIFFWESRNFLIDCLTDESRDPFVNWNSLPSYLNQDRWFFGQPLHQLRQRLFIDTSQKEPSWSGLLDRRSTLLAGHLSAASEPRWGEGEEERTQ